MGNTEPISSFYLKATIPEATMVSQYLKELFLPGVNDQNEFVKLNLFAGHENFLVASRQKLNDKETFWKGKVYFCLKETY